MKQILDFNNNEARDFFLKDESYFNFDLPKYFVFENLLKKLSDKFGNKDLIEFYKNKPKKGRPQRPFPGESENVNHILLNNKDGKYAWRPFQLIHPAIYVALVHKITEETNWQLIIDKFKEFQSNPKIECHSIPVESEDKLSDKANSVKNWWHSIEQKSLELALRYEFVLHTDISDCYGSIYTHSVPWALHTKPFAKKNKGFSHVGNAIDKYLREMSFGQTNGIPQGSVLMDFIAEMILGYADLLLTEKISESNIDDYKVLRYRDDYRIFTNNPQDAEEIAKFLTEILIELGMKLNAQKTMVSNNVVKDSIKPDKLFWNTEKHSAKGLQGHLLIIHQLAEKYPNSGSLRKALDNFFNRVDKIEKSEDNLKVLISILVDIAFNNPRTYPVVCGILSKFLSLIDDEKIQKEILNQIRIRFERIPNTRHIKIWLQRVTLKIDKKIEYNESLCQRVNDSLVEIWNSNWLDDDIKDIIDSANLIDENIIEEINKVIKPEEIKLFEY